VKMTLQPEVEDFHMPIAGIAHNLVIVKIKKTYPGQGMKILNSLLGAGQMMFTKYMIVVSGDINIRDYKNLISHVFENTDFSRDLMFSSGPLDVLDHSSDSFSFGGKAGIDATIKHKEEIAGFIEDTKSVFSDLNDEFFDNAKIFKDFNLSLIKEKIPVLIISVNRSEDFDVVEKACNIFRNKAISGNCKLVIAVEHTVDVNDLFMVSWQLLGNSDPRRDHYFISKDSILIDGTIKVYRKGGFPRKWPNVVCSSNETISLIDKKWNDLGIGDFIISPSSRYNKLGRIGEDEILVNKQLT